MTLQSFLDDHLAPEQRAEFEQHLSTCRACQDEVEATVRFHKLGAELARRPDRPHAIIPKRRGVAAEVDAATTWLRSRRALRACVPLVAAAVVAVYVYGRGDRGSRLGELHEGLAQHRSIEDRLPYGPLDRYRRYDTTRAEAPRGERISEKMLSALSELPDKAGLIAAYIARGEIDAAKGLLSDAGPGDDLDVARAVVARRQGDLATALTLLDQVLARKPRHPQAMWNRAIVLSDLELPQVAAEAFEASLALSEPGWSAEATSRVAELRAHERRRAQEWAIANQACGALAQGVIPDLEIVRRHPWVCRPALSEAVRVAQTRDDVMRLLPVAELIDAESGDTASSELIKRMSSTDFQVRSAHVATYRRLTISRNFSADDGAGMLAKLVASGHGDLVLGALPRTGKLQDLEYQEQYIDLALTSGDPYFAEIAVEREAEMKLAADKPAEAEQILRDAVARCSKRDVELRCAYLHLALAKLYIAQHRPNEATATALAALQRSRRLGLYWDERLLFGVLADAAKFAEHTALERVYSREAGLRQDECAQKRQVHEDAADIARVKLKFAEARAELDRAPTCDAPFTLLRAQIEADLAWIDGTPGRSAELRRDFDRLRKERPLTRGQRAFLDVCQARLVAVDDPAAARQLVGHAIDEANQPEIDDVWAAKARTHAYNTLLLLGAKDLDGAALLAQFAAAGRTPLRASCALGALVDGSQLLLVARDAGGQFTKLYEPRALETPELDVRALVPAAVRSALAGCPRVDVIALPPLYGRPRLLPPELAWSYRGPAGTPKSSGSRRMVALTIEDARPPAALALPKLRDPAREPRGRGVDDVVISGAQATPQRIRKELPLADYAEIHAHGIFDRGVSEVPVIALSPQADGAFALTAPAIAELKLERAPFIALAACHAAHTAPYQHEPLSLPYAFLRAGARGVLAPTTAIPDQDAGAFFRAIGDQILRGADPAAVLRDRRMQRHGSSTDWVHDVVVFD